MKLLAKFKYIFFIFLFISGLFILSSCKKKINNIALIISAPSNAINTNDLDMQDITVYRLTSDGQISKLKRYTDYKLEIIEKTQINGVAGYKNVYSVRAIDFNGLETEEIYLIKNKESAVLPKPLLNIKFNMVNDPKLKDRVKGLPNNPNRFIFTHGYGYKYDKDALLGKYEERGLNVYLLQETAIGSVVSYDLEITNDNYKKIQTQISDDQLSINPEYDKAVYPHYYKDEKQNGQKLKNEGYSEYRTTLTFDKGTDIKYRYIKDGKLTDGLLNLADDLNVSHPVYTIGSSRQRPVSPRAASWFDYILVIPVASILWLFGFGGSLGLAIFFGTIIIRTIAWPIYAKSNNMSLKMQEAKPDLARLEEKYRGMTDKNSLRQKQMEMMQIYKKHKIGFSSFLLMFIQMPIFIAVYNAVYRVAIPGGLFSAKFTRITNSMGFINLTQGGLYVNDKFNWVTLILAILVGVSMFAVQKVSALKPKYLKDKNDTEIKTEQQKSQERTMKIVSIIMLLMMVAFSFTQNAIAFYWIIGNLYTIAQVFIQRAINKKIYLKKQHKSGLEV